MTLPRPGQPTPPVPAGATFDVDDLTPYLSSNRAFYRVDTALVVPDVPVDTWRLRIHGMVDRPLELGYADLLAEAGLRPRADAVKSTSADDMTIGTPLSALTDGRDAMVAVAMGGEPLPLEHGFPARMVVPGLYGYVSATKWLVDIEVTRFADFDAYWTERGYAEQAPIKTSSRIDVPGSFAQLDAGRVTVAGLAWDATPGTHQLEVRATDRTGYTRTSRREPIAPDGSTGWHSVTVIVS